MTTAAKAVPRADLTSSRERLRDLASRGELYALVDAFFEIPLPIERFRLNLKDTDPLFYDLIAWDRVTYEPPSVVKLDSQALDWILNSLSTERWGLFLSSSATLAQLASHFQKFAIVKGPDGNPYFLRFHDAAVLEILLRTWDPRERTTFFGPVSAFALPDLDSVEATFIDHAPLGRSAKGTSGGLAPGLPVPEECLVHLRESQLKLCAEAIDRDLIKVLYWHLRNHHPRPVQFIDRHRLEARLKIAVGRARGYGLGTISDLAGYAALMFELAPNFDQHPSFRRVLEDPSVAGDTKMRRLSQVISDHEWNEAAASYDRDYWVKMVALRKD